MSVHGEQGAFDDLPFESSIDKVVSDEFKKPLTRDQKEEVERQIKKIMNRVRTDREERAKRPDVVVKGDDCTATKWGKDRIIYIKAGSEFGTITSLDELQKDPDKPNICWSCVENLNKRIEAEEKYVDALMDASGFKKGFLLASLLFLAGVALKYLNTWIA